MQTELSISSCLKLARVSLYYAFKSLQSQLMFPVARIVHFIHKHLVGKTLATVTAQHDEIVFGKVGTSAAEFEKSLTGKKIIDARQQGKYFW